MLKVVCLFPQSASLVDQRLERLTWMSLQRSWVSFPIRQVSDQRRWGLRPAAEAAVGWPVLRAFRSDLVLLGWLQDPTDPRAP